MALLTRRRGRKRALQRQRVAARGHTQVLEGEVQRSGPRIYQTRGEPGKSRVRAGGTAGRGRRGEHGRHRPQHGRECTLQTLQGIGVAAPGR